MRHWLMCVLPLLVLCSCAGEGPEPAFNHLSCRGGTLPHQDYLQVHFDGPEDSLTAFYRQLDTQFGKPRVTFLHFNLEEWEEYFHPERRQIDPKMLASPMGVQKILVWDSLPGVWAGQPIDLSVQVEQRKAGPRVVDKTYCTVEVRARGPHGHSVDWASAPGEDLMQRLREMVEEGMGAPHDPLQDTAWASLSQRYERTRKDWQARVRPTLSGECYPPVSVQPETGEYRMQLCEPDGMADTLWGKVVLLDSLGHDLPMVLVDNLADSVVERIRIMDGYLSYSAYLRRLSAVQEIWLILENGREILIYQQGDFTKPLLPFQLQRPPGLDIPALPQGSAANPILTL